MESIETKFCKYCGEKIHMDAVICTKCGRQIEDIKSNHEPVIINNNVSATANNTAGISGKAKSKALAIVLCIIGFCGFAGLHKFYEGKIVMGIIYFFTGGLFLIGTIVDIFALLGKPTTYYV